MFRVLAAVALLGTALLTTSAHAQTKIFIASSGSDTNDGSRFSPKRSLQAAHDAVYPNGSIVILDTAGYGALTITKSVSIGVPPGVNGYSTVSGASDAITIAAGAFDVAIRGMILEGGGGSAAGRGIYAPSFAGTLTVEDCIVRDFGASVLFWSPASARLVVRNTSIRNTATGIWVRTSAAGAKINAVTSDLSVDAAAGIALFAQADIEANSAQLEATRCMLTNGQTGALVQGGTITLDNCTISGNSEAYHFSGAGIIYSRNNNTAINNASPGSGGALTGLPGL